MSMFRWNVRVRVQRNHLHLKISIVGGVQGWLILNLLKKRILVNETKAARNKAIKSKVKTAVKKVEAAIAQKDVEAAKAALKAATIEITKAGTKGVYHKNTVSRKISRLAKAVNSIA